MHDLSPGIPPLINQCIVNMSRNEHQATSALKTGKDTTSSFRSVRETVRLAFNHSLRDSELHSAGHGLHVDFAKDNRLDTINKCFNVMVIIERLEGKDHDKIDWVSQVISAIAGRL